MCSEDRFISDAHERHKPFIPALRRPRIVDLSESEARLVGIASSRLAKAVQSDPISKQEQNKKN